MRFLTILVAAILGLAAASAPERRVAVTIDDLPGVPRACIGGDLAAFGRAYEQLGELVGREP